MSWFASLPTGATTRAGNLEAREQLRAEFEAQRLLRKQKSTQKKKFDSLGVSAPASPSLSTATTPVTSPSRASESVPHSPNMNNQGGGSNNNGGANPPGRGPQPPPQNPPGGPGGPGGPPGGGPPGSGPPGGDPNGHAGNNRGQPNPPQNDEADYDLMDAVDGPRALESSGRITLQINLEDITFWFSELESEMLLAGVGSQWLKLSVLRKNLPVKQREDVKSLLRLKKSEAGLTP